MEINLKTSDLFAPPFLEAYLDIQDHKYTTYEFAGGRGSAKSSFISLEVILQLLQNPQCHALVMRKVGNTLKDSVFAQVEWAIGVLGLSSKFKARTSPYSYEYLETGQMILFRGVQDKSRIKSIKLPFGYIGISWFEELDQFAGDAEIRNINQSIMRGGNKYWQFRSYNPPKSKDNWVNIDALVDKPGRKIYKSDYLGVPKLWLGDEFIIEAESLKKSRPDLYEHEYLGKVTGTGGDIFKNTQEMVMPDEMIANFDNIRHGMDFGFANDPFAFNSLHYDPKHSAIYIFKEIYGRGMSNEMARDRSKPYYGNDYVAGDSAEPKTIAWYRDKGDRVYGVTKGKDSRDFMIKWLADLVHIYIDKERCPNTYREFVNYEYAQDKDGNFISQYPKKNDHSIDAVRYALRNDMHVSRYSFK